MKKSVLQGIVLALVAMAAFALAGDKPWFDMEKCAFCRTLSQEPHLLENMNMEYHEITNGYLTVTVVKSEFHDSYVRAQKEMQKLAERMAQGEEDIYVCGHCEAYGNLMMSGAQIEHVSTAFGDILLMTSDKPEIVDMIKKFGSRSKEEMAKMEQREKVESKD